MKLVLTISVCVLFCVFGIMILKNPSMAPSITDKEEKEVDPKIIAVVLMCCGVIALLSAIVSTYFAQTNDAYAAYEGVNFIASGFGRRR